MCLSIWPPICTWSILLVNIWWLTLHLVIQLLSLWNEAAVATLTVLERVIIFFTDGACSGSGCKCGINILFLGLNAVDAHLLNALGDFERSVRIEVFYAISTVWHHNMIVWRSVRAHSWETWALVETFWSSPSRTAVFLIWGGVVCIVGGFVLVLLSNCEVVCGYLVIHHVMLTLGWWVSSGKTCGKSTVFGDRFLELLN